MDKVGQKQLCGLEDDADETEIPVDVKRIRRLQSFLCSTYHKEECLYSRLCKDKENLR